MPVPGLLEARDLRQQEVQRDDRQQDEDREPDQVAGGEVEPGRMLLVLHLLLGRGRVGNVLAARGLHPRAFASSPSTPAATRPEQRRGQRSAPPDGLGQRQPGGEVDDVVLAEVDERHPERRGVGPADRAGDRAGLREDMGGLDGQGEVEGRHGSERIPAEETVQRLPVGPPELLAVLVHHPPQLRRAPVGHPAAAPPRTTAAPSGPPSSRSGRGRTSRRAGRRRAGTARGGAAARTAPCRAGRGTRSSATRSASARRALIRPGRPKARCRRSVGVTPRPIARSARTG